MNLPKILVIGQPFNNDTGGGITLTNLFAGWDREKLAVACSAYLLLDNVDPKKCNNYYQLGHKEQKWKFPFSLFKRKYTSGTLSFQSNEVKNFTVPKSKLRVKLIMDYFYPLIDLIGISHASHTTELSDQFRRWLDDYNPDIIYSQASSRDGFLFCAKVKAYLNKPMVFHMMDDWPSTIADKGIMKKYWQKKINQEFRDFLNVTDLFMTISHEMAREYKTRYQKDSLVFHNPIDIDFWQQHQRKNYSLGNPPTILYAGRTGLGIQSTLVSIAKAVESINNKLHINLQFIIQTAEKPEWVEEYSCVVHKGFVPYLELPKAFAESDLMILPYDFSTDAIKYIQFSMPTKASEYMACGSPILVFAPEVTAIVKDAREFGWAKIVTENSVEQLASAIESLIIDEEERQHLSQTAISLAMNSHGAHVVTKKFREAICSLAPEHLVENEKK